jgi:hypothetical protein
LISTETGLRALFAYVNRELRHNELMENVRNLIREFGVE